MERGEAQLAAVDAELRRHGGRWLLPDPGAPGPSLADVAVYAWVSGFARFDLPRNAASYPGLRSWLARMDARPSVRASRGAVGRPFDGWLRERTAARPSEAGAEPG